MSDQRAWEMRVFLQVVARGSFSGAGRIVGITPSSTAKLIGRIEARLGARLIERSTRSLRLTSEGELYRERAEAILGDLDALDAEVVGEARAPSGLIRINVSVPFGHHCLMPQLPEFARLYPKISLDLTLTDDVVDIYATGADIAFRIGQLADSALLAIRLGEARRRIVAAPAYLKEYGITQTAADLDRHKCLGFNFRRAAPVWPLQAVGRLIDREAQGAIAANDGETVRGLATLGLGLARLAEFHIKEDLKAARLVTVLDDALVDSEAVHALYLGREHAPGRVRAFLDFMTPRLRETLR